MKIQFGELFMRISKVKNEILCSKLKDDLLDFQRALHFRKKVRVIDYDEVNLRKSLNIFFPPKKLIAEKLLF